MYSRQHENTRGASARMHAHHAITFLCNWTRMVIHGEIFDDAARESLQISKSHEPIYILSVQSPVHSRRTKEIDSGVPISAVCRRMFTFALAALLALCLASVMAAPLQPNSSTSAQEGKTKLMLEITHACVYVARILRLHAWGCSNFCSAWCYLSLVASNLTFP